MNLTKLNENLNNVQSLPDKPSLTAEELKQEFDKAPNAIKDYINEILTVELIKILTELERGISTGESAVSTINSTITTMKTKLDGIEAGANKYTHPTGAGNRHIPSGGSSGQVLKYKANGDVQWADDENTTYSNATTSKSGLMSSTDKTKLNGIATGANNYIHPSSAGNKHIPSGGSSGQVLKYKASGEAQWADEKDTTYSAASTSTAGLMSAADKTKLNGIATGATKNNITRGTAAPSGGNDGDIYIQNF